MHLNVPLILYSVLAIFTLHLYFKYRHEQTGGTESLHWGWQLALVVAVIIIGLWFVNWVQL